MKLLILVSVLAAAVNAVPQGYGGTALSIGPGLSSAGGYGGSCGPGQVLHVDGSCATPDVTRNVYVYEAPPTAPIVGPPPVIPPPRVEHNILFIRTPENVPGLEPYVVPPPQQRNIVYVLSKRPELDQQVVHVPGPDQQTPEVFFVNYKEGDNPTLPTGEDLQSALRAASKGAGEVVGGGVGSGGFLTGIGDSDSIYTPPIAPSPGIFTPPIVTPPTLYRQP